MKMNPTDNAAVLSWLKTKKHDLERELFNPLGQIRAPVTTQALRHLSDNATVLKWIAEQVEEVTYDRRGYIAEVEVTDEDRNLELRSK